MQGRPKGRHVDPDALRRRAGAARRRAARARPADRVPAPDPGPLRLPLGRAPRRARAGDEARDDRGLRGRDVLSPLRRREGRRSAAAAAHRARLRFALVRAGRRATRCSTRCRACSARDVRVLDAPCVGRCEQAPVAVVGQNPVDHATRRRDRWTRSPRAQSSAPTPAYIDYAAYRARRRLRTLARLRRRQARRRRR